MAPEKFTITFNSSCQVFFISIFEFSKFLDCAVPCLFVFIKITYIFTIKLAQKIKKEIGRPLDLHCYHFESASIRLSTRPFAVSEKKLIILEPRGIF